MKQVQLSMCGPQLQVVMCWAWASGPEPGPACSRGSIRLKARASILVSPRPELRLRIKSYRTQWDLKSGSGGAVPVRHQDIIDLEVALALKVCIIFLPWMSHNPTRTRLLPLRNLRWINAKTMLPLTRAGRFKYLNIMCQWFVVAPTQGSFTKSTQRRCTILRA